MRIINSENTSGQELIIQPFMELPVGKTLYLTIRVGGMSKGNWPVKRLAKNQAYEWITVDLNDVDTWSPNGAGEQRLYEVEIHLETGGMKSQRLSTYRCHIGIRNAYLVDRRDSIGRSFYFEVNGKAIVSKGCNLIPPHVIPSAITDSTWVAQVRHMKSAGMNMVRVWSGGVYPPEAFYFACDTSGILVWQDLMFGSLVPGTRSFADSARKEATELALRITNHPSVVLLCGNNELDVAWKNWGWQETYRLSKQDQRKVGRANHNFFNKILAEASWPIENYTPTSPLSNWGNAKGLTEGDLHYWGVWHGDSTFSSFKNNVGRFVSEWGFQSYPDSALMAKYIDPDSLYLGSPAVARLQRSYKTDRPIWEAIERELGEERPTTLGGFIEASQRAQAKAYGMAIEAHLGAQPHCMGTLLWQLNDCWPGPSWSIIDYEGNPKPAYEVVKRLYSAP